MVPKPAKPAVVPDEDDDLDLWNGKFNSSRPARSAPPRKAPPPPPAESTSSDEYSETESEALAASQARQTAAKLRNHNPIKAPTIDLPSADDLFKAIKGPPAFLNPEATRQIPEISSSHGGTAGSCQHLPTSDSTTKDQDWDISRMAPKLKGLDEDQPQAGVISAAATRFKADDGGEAAAAVFSNAATVAMLGGSPQQEEGRDRGNKRASKAMGVEEFLDKSGAQLPRKRQDRKDKEKEKRGKGQSTHSHWKSEAEMALRQQYD